MEKFSQKSKYFQCFESTTRMLVKEAFRLAKTDLKVALERMLDAIEADKENLDTQCEYSWLLFKDCKSVGGARKAVEQVLKTRSDHQQALMLMAIYLSDEFEYLSEDQPKEMIEERKQYFIQSINSPLKGQWIAHAYMYLAKILYYLEGNAKEALEFLEAAVKEKPYQIEPYVALVEISSEQQIYEKALRYCKKGLQNQSQYKNLSLLYYFCKIMYFQHIHGKESSNRDKDIEQKEQEVIIYATQYLKRQTKINDDDDDQVQRQLLIKYVRARCYFNQKQGKNALADFEDILNVQEDYLDVLLRKAELLFVFHKPNEALSLFNYAEQILPQDRFSKYDLNLKNRYEKFQS